jgi:hypothetical protein
MQVSRENAWTCVLRDGAAAPEDGTIKRAAKQQQQQQQQHRKSIRGNLLLLQYNIMEGATYWKAQAEKFKAERDREIAERVREAEIFKAERDREIAERDHTIAQDSVLRETSMERTYTRRSDDGTTRQPRLPELTLNDLIEPSVKGKERKGTCIPDVVIHRCNNEMWAEPKNITIPIYSDNQSTRLPSELGAKGGSGTFSYCNEIEVQILVQAMVNDAIRCLGLRGVLKSHVEVAMYSMIPDVVVVKVRGSIIFVVEVKSPERSNGQVFESKTVAGQIWLYLQCMRQHGCERPLGAIMTYNKIRLVSLDNLWEDDEHKKCVVDAQSALQSDVRTQHTEAAAEEKADHSPYRKTVQLKDINAKYEGRFKSNAVKSNADDEDSEVDSHVYCSRIFEQQSVFPALLQALQIAFLGCDPTKIHKILPVVENNDDLGGRLFLKMSVGGYKIVVTRKKDFKANAREFPSNKSTDFYMLTQLGAGKMGTTYLACNSSGKLAAIKLYVPKRSSEALEEKRQEAWEANVAALSEIRDTELSRWSELLPQYRGVCSCVLDGLPALVLPYGREISSVQDRKNTLKDLKSALLSYAKKGWKYDGEDLRWRHVLRDHNNVLFLADLESLVRCVPPGVLPPDEIIKKAVSDQIKELVRRINEPAIHASPSLDGVGTSGEGTPTFTRVRKRPGAELMKDATR